MKIDSITQGKKIKEAFLSWALKMEGPIFMKFGPARVTIELSDGYR